MAGDWIKCEISLREKLEVWQIASSLDLDIDAVVGKLLHIWGWFDQHTTDGDAHCVTNVTLLRLDHSVNAKGFCQEMMKCGWMFLEDGVIKIPDFDKHNGQSAKKRAQTARRTAKYRGQTNCDAPSVTNVTLKASPEKRREEYIKKKTKQKRFVPPTLEEVTTYCLGRDNGISPAAFIDHYATNNWMRGRNKISNWKACVRTWENNKSQSTPSPATASSVLL
tara:strand:+ start:333 stop:998 length:666 start_codon:yes stop_codon:yes gene_type:complete